MLAHSSRYQTVLATHCLSRQLRDKMRATFSPLVGNEEQTHYFGSSYWFEVQASFCRLFCDPEWKAVIIRNTLYSPWNF